MSLAPRGEATKRTWHAQDSALLMNNFVHRQLFRESSIIRIISRGHIMNNLSIVKLKHTNDSEESPVPSGLLRNHRQSDNSEDENE
jgi:hypothetical protein